jgi:nitrate reductase beta subunit
METLEQVLKHWEKDVEIDQTEPGKELLRIPVLHNKYLSILTIMNDSKFLKKIIKRILLIIRYNRSRRY